MSSIKQKTTKKNITKKNKNKCEDIYDDVKDYQLFENGIVILPNTFEMNNTLNNRNKKRLRSRSKSIEEKTRSKSKKIKTTTTKKNYKSKKFFV